MSISELKTKAKECLNGKGKDAAITLLVYFIILVVLSTVLNAIFPGKTTVVDYTELGLGKVETTTTNPLASLINSFASMFLSLGLTRYYLKIARGEEASIMDLFSGKDVILKFFVSGIIAGLLIFGGCILLVIPGIILAFGYSMITYIYLDNPEVGITDVLKKSREMMKGHKWQFFLLGLSFIGWALLVPVTLGLIMFWLAPYMGVTQALFYDSIKE